MAYHRKIKTTNINGNILSTFIFYALHGIFTMCVKHDKPQQNIAYVMTLDDLSILGTLSETAKMAFLQILERLC